MLSYNELVKLNAGFRIKMQAIKPLPARLQTSEQTDIKITELSNT